MNRRQFLESSGAVAFAWLAGCATDGLVADSEKPVIDTDSDRTEIHSGAWTEYGYDAQTTTDARSETEPAGWAQQHWRTWGKHLAIARREPFTPVPLGETVLIELSPGGQGVVAVDAATGDPQWRREIPGVRNGSIIGDTGFFTGDSTVAAISLSDGSLYWQRETEAHEPATRVTVADQVCYLSFDGATLEARDARTGDLQWTYGEAWAPGAPAVHDDTVYISGGGTVHAVPTDPEFEDDEHETKDVPIAVPRWTRSLPAWPESYHHQHSVVIDASTDLLFAVTGGESANVLRALDTATGTEVWSYTVDQGPITGRPAIADETAYVGTESGVVALDYTDGEPTQLWEHTDESTVPDAPTVTSETVYVTFQHGEIRALDRDSGTRRWATFPRHPTATSPIVHDGRIYVGTEFGTLAFEHRDDPGSAETGQWPTRKGTTGRTGAATTAPSLREPLDLEWIRYASRSNTAPLLADGIAVLGTAAVTAFDAASGYPIWQARPATEGTLLGASTDGTRVYSCGTWGMEDRASVIEAYDLKTGARDWTYTPEGRPVGGPAIYNGLVYVGIEHGGIVGLDTETGSLERRLDHPGTAWRFGIAADRLVTGVVNRSVYCWDLATGQRVWDRDLPHTTADRGVLVDNGTAYVSQAEGNLYAFDIADGTLRWTYEPQDHNTVTDGVLDAEHLYTRLSGQLVAFDRASGDPVWRTPSTGRELVRVGEALVEIVGGVPTVRETRDGSVRWALSADDVFQGASRVERLPDERVRGVTGVAVGTDGLYVDTMHLLLKYT